MHRLMLEAKEHPANAFATLTYTDENLPLTSRALATLEPAHLRDFLKRLRKRHEPERLRFYAVGEYGDKTWRPHYHLALFNFPTCLRGRTDVIRRDRTGYCCSVCALVGRTWGKGSVYLGTVEDDSAQYLAGYVTKKMTRTDDVRLNGRWPEFSRMSLRPGIGYGAVARLVRLHNQVNLDTSEGDVPVTLRHGRKELPLGRYLRKNLRKALGRDEKAPDAASSAYQKTMLILRWRARSDKNNPSFRSHVISENRGRVARTLARAKLYKQRKDQL